MPKYVIERDVPGIGSAGFDRKAGARQSNLAIEEMGHKVQWLHSYVVADRTYCVYIAPDPEAIREHSRRSGFPITSIAEVVEVIDPTTAE
jgi:hypothetical protein